MKSAGEHYEIGAHRERFDGFECMSAKTNTDRHPANLTFELYTQLPLKQRFRPGRGSLGAYTRRFT
jgi:hypothetical protein